MLQIILTAEKKFGRYASRARAMLRFLGRLVKEKAAVEVHLVGNAVMNKNVLSYVSPRKFFRPDISGKALGEIYLNPTYIAAHGEDVDLMLVHGFLHLLGYDHKRKSDRIKMEKKEDALLKQFYRSKSS
ncbi:MAG: rRNA maturation RNase YbeY [bacterium]|nr:rRNA maturation RNase YbeY [bacterium]